MAKDVFHDVVKQALIKDGWEITDDPYRLSVGGVEMAIDLGATLIGAAQQDGTKIAVEVKSFIGKSSISEFHTAHGQFLDYYGALEDYEPDRILYLAVPLNTYKTFFQLSFTQKMVKRSQLKLVIYDPDNEVIVQWL
jgi:hypothetical protein